MRTSTNFVDGRFAGMTKTLDDLDAAASECEIHVEILDRTALYEVLAELVFDI